MGTSLSSIDSYLLDITIEEIQSEYLRLENGPLEIIKYVYRGRFMYNVAQYGRLDILKFAVENEIPIGKNICSTACYHGREEFVRWFVDNIKCECNFEYYYCISFAMLGYNSKIFHILFDENRSEQFENVFNIALNRVQYTSTDIMKYLYQHGSGKLSIGSIRRYIDIIIGRIQNIELCEQVLKDNLELMRDIAPKNIPNSKKMIDWLLKNKVISVGTLISTVFNNLSGFGSIWKIKMLMNRHYDDVIYEMTKRDVTVDKWFNEKGFTLNWHAYRRLLLITENPDKEKIKWIEKEILQTD